VVRLETQSRLDRTPEFRKHLHYKRRLFAVRDFYDDDSVQGRFGEYGRPAPNYDMQRVLSCKNTRSAALMSASVSFALFIPRYLLIGGITILGIVFFSPQLNAMGDKADFEQILPYVISNFVPVGLMGLLLAGLLAAFMSTFSATINAGAAYIVNDIYKGYINKTRRTKLM
jgi:Na+/proline symporter